MCALIADILDEERMEVVFERFRPEVVFHAAAHKHVPLMEMQPGEALKNNTLGRPQLRLRHHVMALNVLFLYLQTRLSILQMLWARLSEWLS